MPPPTDVEGVFHLCGALNFLKDYIPSFALVMEPVHALKRKDVPFVWTGTQQKAFDKSQRTHLKPTKHCNYASEKQLTVQCDASLYGLAAVLLGQSQLILLSLGPHLLIYFVCDVQCLQLTLIWLNAFHVNPDGMILYFVSCVYRFLVYNTPLHKLSMLSVHNTQTNFTKNNLICQGCSYHIFILPQLNFEICPKFRGPEI